MDFSSRGAEGVEAAGEEERPPSSPFPSSVPLEVFPDGSLTTWPHTFSREVPEQLLDGLKLNTT